MNREIHGLCRALVAALALLIAGATVARSGVPDPRTSTVPRCLNVCPAGDLGFTITVRDVNNTPQRNVTVALDIAACPGSVALLCDDCPELSGYDPVRRFFSRLTDAAGQATFHLCGTIDCPGGGTNWIEVSGDGVVLALVTFVDTDQDHDLDVDAADVAIVTAALGNVNPAADQDCDRVITAADVAVVSAHVGHVCGGTTPTLPRSWGLLKASYR